MKLKKRIYLLTPLLVLCCIVAAGVFMKNNDTNAAGENNLSYLINKGSYKGTLLSTEIANDEELKAQYKIEEFDVTLFDYNGDAWNAFSAFRFGQSENSDSQKNFFSFTGGKVQPIYRQLNSSSKYSKSVLYPYYTGADREYIDTLYSGPNSGGIAAKQGILLKELREDAKLPSFNTAVGLGGLSNANKAGLREHILFNPDLSTLSNHPVYNEIARYWNDFGYSYDNESFNVDKIREGTYAAKFQFVYDKKNGRYTYNSLTNHAQYNEKTGKIELYNEPLGVTNGSKSQMPIFYGDLFGDGNIINVHIDKYMNASSAETTAPNTKGNYSIGTGATFDNSNLKYGYNNAIQKKNYDWHSTNGYWAIYDQVKEQYIGYYLYPGEIGFRNSLELYDFKVPADNLSADAYDSTCTSDGPNGGDEYRDDNFNVSDTIEVDKLEHIFLKFRVGDQYKNISKTEKNKFTIILQNKKEHLYGVLGTAFATQTNEKKSFSSGDIKFVSYSYEYSSEDYGKWIELKIPVNTNDFGDDFGEKIEQISIMPYYDVSDDVKTTNFDSEKYISFELSELALGYKYIRGNTELPDATAIGSFLPLHKIENSYEGENTGTKEKWNNIHDDTIRLYSKENFENIANRSVTNAFHADGLTAARVNDYGGTAPHFGMSMELDFFLTNDKKIGLDKNGDGVIEDNEKEDIFFEFSGDDDLWVFIDDKLVIDLGGKHTKEMVKINFRSGNVWYGTNPPYTVTGYGSINSTNKTQTFNYLNDENLKDIFKPGQHTMKIFYLERASGTSNCFISFNLPRIPQGGLTVSKEIKEAENSDIALPTDLNKDGYDDLNTDTDFSNDLIPYVKNVNGYKTIGWTKPDGTDIDDDDEPMVYTFEAKYKILELYTDSNVSGYYDGTYLLYKNNDENILLNGLAITNIEEPYKDGEYFVYNVQFQVPVGYSANIQLPEDSCIMHVSEFDSTQNDSSIDSRFELHKTTLYDVDKVIIGIDDGSYNNRLTYSAGNSGIEVKEGTDIRLTFTNYYAAELYELEIEKKFKDGDPVPVGQGIIYTVECGLQHHNGEECDNPLCGNPLYISMVIQNNKDENGNLLNPNPNIITVKDLPKGNYKVSEKADWSWRYECYNVDFHRSDTGSTATGTVISAEKQ